MKKFKSITLILVLSVVVIILTPLSSCSDLQCIDGNNEMVTEPRAVPSFFNGISLSADFTVFIKNSTKDSILVEAESNLMKNIITEVRNHQLEIRSAENICLNPRKPVIIRVYSSTIQNLNIAGSGIIQTDSIKAEKLRVVVSGSGSLKSAISVNNLEAIIAGSGNIEVWGKAAKSHFEISGSGNLESYGLDQDSCVSAISGTGNMFVFVRQSLEASISGSGSVYFKGNPEVETQISGSGKVVNQQNGANSAYSAKGNFSTPAIRSLFMIY